MYFSKLKEKRQKAYRIKSYDEILINTLISMFTWRGLDEALQKKVCMLENILIRNGAAAIFKLMPEMANTGNDSNVGEYIVTDADLCGEPDVYGIGRNDEVRVVTSDWLIQLTALRTGVLRLSSAEFEREVASVDGKIGELIASRTDDFGGAENGKV
jgi:hypothetical protein